MYCNNKLWEMRTIFFSFCGQVLLLYVTGWKIMNLICDVDRAVSSTQEMHAAVTFLCFFFQRDGLELLMMRKVKVIVFCLDISLIHEVKFIYVGSRRARERALLDDVNQGISSSSEDLSFFFVL